MRFLRQNTAVHISVGPFYDVGDAVTPEEALTVTNFTAYFITEDDDNTVTTSATLTITASAGSNDMVHRAGAVYDLELTAAQTNFTGRAMLHIYDTSDVLPVFHEFMIMPQAVYDSLFGGGNGQTLDYLNIDLVRANNSTSVIDNFEDFFQNPDFGKWYNTDDGNIVTAPDVQGTVASTPTPTATAFDSDLFVATDTKAYVGWKIVFTGGATNPHDQCIVTAYNGSGVVTVTALPGGAPGVGDPFVAGPSRDK